MASALWTLAVCVAYLSITDVLLGSVAEDADCHHGDTVYPLGTQWTQPGYCRWFICEENNSIVEKGCPDYELKEGCYMSEYDLTQNYPDCCPKLNCPDQDEIVVQDWVNH